MRIIVFEFQEEQTSKSRLLFNDRQQEALDKLPNRFSFTQAMAAIGRRHSATANFLRKCISRGLVRKLDDGYEKL